MASRGPARRSEAGGRSGSGAQADSAGSRRGALVLVGLVVTAAAAAVLGVVQWWELLDVQRGGDAFCRVGSGFDCAAVWETPVAKRVHAMTGVPVAGWGVVWGLGALVAAVLVGHARRRGRAGAVALGTVRLFALAGGLVVVGLLAVSLRAGVLCLTCVGTYALVGAYGVLAFVGASGPAGRVGRSLPLAVGLGLAGYLAVLWPGLMTPVEPAGNVSESPAADAGGDPLRRFLRDLPVASKRALWTALAEYRSRSPVDGSKFGVRGATGPAFAPTHIVEFSDILCSHCRRLNQAMDEVGKRAPEGSFRREVRMFPLDAECNPKLPPGYTDGTGTRCAGARVLICLEGRASYASVKERLFREQTRLDAAGVFRIAQEGSGLSRSALERCVRAPETAQKLREDIEYAWLYRLKGTPLVVINGKQGSAAGPFIFAMILAGGDPDHPAFEALAPPS